MAFDIHTETPVQTFYPGPLFDPLQRRTGLDPVAGIPPYGLPPDAVDLNACQLEDSKLHLEVDPRDSFFGDCIRVIDEPGEAPLAPDMPPFGWSGKQLLGGHAMTAARLHGELVLDFGKTRDGWIPFAVGRSSRLVGDEGILAAPDGYELPIAENEVSLIDPESRGTLELATGRVFNLHFNCRFTNTAIRTLLGLNPSLEEPPLLFPGTPHSGHALAWFTTTDDGALCFKLAAQMFLPLGEGLPESPLTMPASASPRSRQDDFPARNSSLHPFIFLACRECPAIGPRQESKRWRKSPIGAALEDRENGTLRLTCWPKETYFGDDFDVLSTELGGVARAQSPLFGGAVVQLGKIVDGFAPFSLSLSPPSAAYEPKFAPLLELLPPGTRPGLVGLRGDLAFPKQLYHQRNLSLNTDPYKVSVGIVEIATGEIRGAVLRKFLFQDLMLTLLHIEPRTPTDSFAYIATGAFRLESGRLSLDLAGALTIPYPTGYKFPLPDGGATVAKEGSQLTPFVRLSAIETDAFAPARVDEPLRFSGSGHVRGRRADTILFEIEPTDAPDVVAIELDLDDLRIRGRGATPHEARLGDRRLVTGELTRDEGAPCNYYLTVSERATDLQLVSADEDLDLWFTGQVVA